MTRLKWERPRKRAYFSLKTQNVGAVIYLFLGCHSRGLEIMLGKDPFPDAGELSVMLSSLRISGEGFEEIGTRVQKGSICLREQKIIEDAEVIQKIVEDAGGIERFIAVFRSCQQENSARWRALADWYRWVKIGRPAGGGRGETWRLAERYHAHPDTLRRQREDLILEIADEIAHPFCEFYDTDGRLAGQTDCRSC